MQRNRFCKHITNKVIIFQKNGFTLLEVLISLVIVIIITTAVLSTVLFLQSQPIINEIRLKAMHQLLNAMSLSLVNKDQSYPIAKTLTITLSNGKQVPINLLIKEENKNSIIEGDVTWNYAGESGSAVASILKE